MSRIPQRLSYLDPIPASFRFSRRRRNVAGVFFWRPLRPDCGQVLSEELRTGQEALCRSMRSTEYPVRSTQYGVRSTEYAVRNTQYGVRSTE